MDQTKLLFCMGLNDMKFISCKLFDKNMLRLIFNFLRINLCRKNCDCEKIIAQRTCSPENISYIRARITPIIHEIKTLWYPSHEYFLCHLSVIEQENCILIISALNGYEIYRGKKTGYISDCIPLPITSISIAFNVIAENPAKNHKCVLQYENLLIKENASSYYHPSRFSIDGQNYSLLYHAIGKIMQPDAPFPENLSKIKQKIFENCKETIISGFLKIS